MNVMKIYCPDLYPLKRPKYMTPERDKFLREYKDVSVAALAEQLKLSERIVIGYLQKLGLRKFSKGGED